MKNINIDKEMELFLEAACGVGQNPEDTGCTPAGASKSKSKPKIKVPKIKIPAMRKENSTAQIGAKIRRVGGTISRCSSLKSIIKFFSSHHQANFCSI